MRKRGLLPALALLLLLPHDVLAQDGFMFGRPNAMVTLRAGPVLHRADGDLFNFFRSELTLDRGDFRAPALSADLSVWLHPRADLVLGAGWSSVTSRSAFREFDEVVYVDGEEVLRPIEQTTKFRVTPVTASARFYPLSRGRSVSDLAWVPARTTPYLGAGGGVAWYRLAQDGDFVGDDLGIFSASFETTGVTPVAHVLAGLDHWFSARVGVNVEGRYTMGSAQPGDDFRTWDTVDLSGAQLGVGLTLRW